ncbi:hypothetical protein Sinac_1762 [Singulisphaera acidiphila DSM 18658]|uniref:Uncharacterized protein n=1 Tax=Singulisphaera acidiphila (strain ATCC BAA-1392 / DSM 18658 / VKM B-2454 / MOB10) TaxID=886293 RepID=L0DBB6_SINAD|nr:hypothetical protein Sinac_1762 [Singulisphaera acidiphila DSM 18658]
MSSEYGTRMIIKNSGAIRLLGPTLSTIIEINPIQARTGLPQSQGMLKAAASVLVEASLPSKNRDEAGGPCPPDEDHSSARTVSIHRRCWYDSRTASATIWALSPSR